MGKKNEKKNWLTYLGYICIIVIISLIVCIVLNEFNNTSKTIQTGGLMTISDMATTNISGSNYSSRTDTSNDMKPKMQLLLKSSRTNLYILEMLK